MYVLKNKMNKAPKGNQEKISHPFPYFWRTQKVEDIRVEAWGTGQLQAPNIYITQQ